MCYAEKFRIGKERRYSTRTMLRIAARGALHASTFDLDAISIKLNYATRRVRYLTILDTMSRGTFRRLSSGSLSITTQGRGYSLAASTATCA
jgi:hypothetical protein